MRPLRWLSISITLALIASNALAGDWHQWRGPDQNGISPEPFGWTQGEPTELWRVPLGEGFSSVVVVKGRAYTMYSDDTDEYVICVNADTGDEIWRRRTDARYFDSRGSGPRSTPTVVDGSVYVETPKGKVFALDASNGDVRWMRDMQAEFGGRMPNWGYSGSVLIAGDVAYIEAGGSDDHAFLALNRRSGKVIWNSHTDSASYSSPMIHTILGSDQLVHFTESGLVGVTPDSGSVLWTYGWKPPVVHAMTPVLVGDDRLLISAGYDKGAVMVRIEKDGKGFRASQVWATRELKSRMATPVLRDGYLYGFDNGTLKCLDVETGAEMWAQRGFGEGSALIAGDKLVVLSDHGTLSVAEINPNTYVELVSANVLQGPRTWAVPTMANGKLYLRDEHQLVCLKIGD
ncbi:MAG: PQQ-like beta-propeller repeat protein [Candidatus Poribacteria bacterium]|nr:PQQ-like beta-propeller repeat protein [Candidatus Poribacteria bacterium]